MRSLLAALLFFAAPPALVGFAVSLRTAGVVDARQDVEARVLRFRDLAARAADAEGVPLPLLLAVASVESSGDPSARSRAGAVGLMQLLPTTALELALGAGEPEPELTDPATSLRLGARYLRERRAAFGAHPCALELSLCAYNAGPGAVAGWIRDEPAPEDPEEIGGWIPSHYGETRAFVRRVLAWQSRWSLLLREKH